MDNAVNHADAGVRAVLDALHRDYQSHHPRAVIDAYRYSPVTIRVRIVDPDFAGKDIVEREDMVWPILEALPDPLREDVGMVLMLTPDEKAASPANSEFDHPTPSRLAT